MGPLSGHTELRFTGSQGTNQPCSPRAVWGSKQRGLAASGSHRDICSSCHGAALHADPKIWVPVGVCFSSLPSSQHQWPSNSKGSAKTESTRKQLFMHFQHSTMVNLCFLFNAVRCRKELEKCLREILVFSLPFRSFKLGHFTKKSSTV